MKFLFVVLALAMYEAFALSGRCDQLCNCKIGPTHCAKVQSRLGPHQMQYPGCLNQCFSSCCEPNIGNSSAEGSVGSLSEIRQGECTDNIYVEVVTGTHNAVGLVEPCPNIYLAAVVRTRE